MNRKDIETAIFYNLLSSYIAGNLMDNSLKSQLMSDLSTLLPNKFYIAVSFRLCLSNQKAKDIDINVNANKYKAANSSEYTVQIFDYIKENSEVPHWIYRTGRSSAIIFFNPESILFDVTSKLSDIHNWILERFKLESFWGVSSISNDPALLPELSEEALNASGSTHFSSISTSTGPAYCKDDMSKTSDLNGMNQNMNQNGIFYPKELENLIILSIKSCDIARLNFLLHILKDENCLIRCISSSSLSLLNTKIADTIKKFNNSMHNFDTCIEKLSLYVESYDADLSSYFDLLSEMLNDICYSINRKKSIQKNALASEIKEYLLANFRDYNLSLANTASLFEVSEGYLSSIFKEQTSTSFTDYVEILRISEACRLLSETEEPINDIALKCGYNNVYSFRRAFKRIHTISPKEFRIKGDI